MKDKVLSLIINFKIVGYIRCELIYEAHPVVFYAHKNKCTTLNQRHFRCLLSFAFPMFIIFLQCYKWLKWCQIQEYAFNFYFSLNHRILNLYNIVLQIREISVEVIFKEKPNNT